MVTFINVSALAPIGNLLVFLLVWVVTYALLTQFFHGNKAINALIGFVLGILTIISQTLTEALFSITPWFAVILIIIVLLTVTFKSMGIFEGSVLQGAKWIMVAFIAIGFIVAVLSFVREKSVVNEINETMDFSKTSTVLFHPVILGAMLLFGVGVFTIALLTSGGGLH